VGALRLSASHRWAEGKRQKWEVGAHKAEGRRQKWEVGAHKAEGKRQEWEVGAQRLSASHRWASFTFYLLPFRVLNALRHLRGRHLLPFTFPLFPGTRE
jgi:hypothetical protein